LGQRDGPTRLGEQPAVGHGTVFDPESMKMGWIERPSGTRAMCHVNPGFRCPAMNETRTSAGENLFLYGKRLTAGPIWNVIAASFHASGVTQRSQPMNGLWVLT